MSLEKHNRTFSILGILGGVVFFIGDALLFLTPNFQMDTDARMDWLTMPLWRFGTSAICGVAGMVLLFFGVASMYHALCNEKASSKMKALWITGAIGTSLTAFGHFAIGCWEPMQYKAMTSIGLTEEQIETVVSVQSPWINAISGIAIILLVVQCVTYICIILKGIIKCPYWMAIFNNLVIAAIGMLLYFVMRPFGIQGLCSGFESLGEGLMYISSFWYWTKELKNRSI